MPLSKVPASIFSFPAYEWDNAVRFLSRQKLKLSVDIHSTDPRNDALYKGHQVDCLMLLFMETAPCPRLRLQSFV